MTPPARFHCHQSPEQSEFAIGKAVEIPQRSLNSSHIPNTRSSLPLADRTDIAHLPQPIPKINLEAEVSGFFHRIEYIAGDPNHPSF